MGLHLVATVAVETVWAICWNGPAQGTVVEVKVGDGVLHVTKTAYDGTHVYKNSGWCLGPGGRGQGIARFQWSKTLVV